METSCGSITVSDQFDRRCDLTPRNLLEVVIDTDSHPDAESLMGWLKDHATFEHNEADEFILWIPPEHKLDMSYGIGVPSFVERALAAARDIQEGKDDQGYLLIAIL